jgi:hypothetical protein
MLKQEHRGPVIKGPLLLPFRACSFRMMSPAAQGPSFILVQTASEDVEAGLERKLGITPAPPNLHSTIRVLCSFRGY